MNRKFKFRVWHEEDKCFIYIKPFDPHTITGGGYNKDKSCYYYFWPDANIGGELCKIKNCHLQNRPVQEYIGLKDKNGREIYEGDIIKWKTELINEIGEVYFDDKSCGFRINTILGNVRANFNGVESKDLEIIGNILENPEFFK